MLRSACRLSRRPRCTGIERSSRSQLGIWGDTEGTTSLEFVAVNSHGGLCAFGANDPPYRNKFEGTCSPQTRRPINRKFYCPANRKVTLSCKQHSTAANVQGFSRTADLWPTATQHPILDLFLERKPAVLTPIG